MDAAGEEEQDESAERVHRAQSHDADQPPSPQHLLHALQDPLPRHRHQEVRHTPSLPPPILLPLVPSAHYSCHVFIYHAQPHRDFLHHHVVTNLGSVLDFAVWI